MVIYGFLGSSSSETTTDIGIGTGIDSTGANTGTNDTFSGPYSGTGLT